MKRALKAIFCPWPSAQNVLIFIFLIYLLSLVDLSFSDWAAWVQALGSIFAIFVAIAVSNTAEVRLRKDTIKRGRVFKMAIINLVRSLEFSVVELHREITDPDPSKDLNLSDLLTEVEQNLSALNGVDLLGFPEEGMLVPFMSIKAVIKEMLISARKVVSASDMDSLDQFEVVKKIDRTFSVFNENYKKLRDASRGNDE